MKHLFPSFLLAALLMVVILATPARAATPFNFLDHPSLDDMRRYIEQTFPLGSKREDLRHAFVDEGKAVLVEHPRHKGVEKYIHDINLCNRYIFRWNISADFDEAGKLEQAYINGRFVFMSGKTPFTISLYSVGKRTKTRQMSRQTPEATAGRQEIKYWLFDADGDTNTEDDELADGHGLLRADPGYIGATLDYEKVEPWRSIFYDDNAGDIEQYPSCKNILIHDPGFEELMRPEIDKLQKTLDDLKAPDAATPAKP